MGQPLKCSAPNEVDNGTLLHFQPFGLALCSFEEKESSMSSTTDLPAVLPSGSPVNAMLLQWR